MKLFYGKRVHSIILTPVPGTPKKAQWFAIVSRYVATVLYRTLHSHITPPLDSSIVCLLLLVEYVVFSMAVWNVYSQDVTYVTFPDPHDPSFGALDYQQNIAQTGMPTTTASFSANPNRVSKHQSTSHSMDGEAPHKNICGFVYDVISFRDMWSIEHKLSVEISELSEPLNSSSASNVSLHGVYICGFLLPLLK